MDIDCIFNCMLYLDINNITKVLLVNRFISNIKTEYLFKLLCERDYKLDYEKMSVKSYLKRCNL